MPPQDTDPTLNCSSMINIMVSVNDAEFVTSSSDLQSNGGSMEAYSCDVVSRCQCEGHYGLEERDLLLAMVPSCLCTRQTTGQE